VSRRNIELILLLVATPIVILPFAMLIIHDGGTPTLETLGTPIGIAAAFAIAHLAVRKFAPGADPALLPISYALSGIGLAFVTRLAPDMAIRQLIWLFVGIAFMILILVFVRRIDKSANYKYTLMILGLALLLSPLLPGIGLEQYGSRIWLHLGSFSFQPGELAKLCIVLFLAAYLAQNREMLSVFTLRVGPFHLPDMRTMLPLLLMWGVSMVIVIFEKDLGSAVIVFLVFLTMLYVATGKKSYLVFGLVLAAIGGVGAYLGFSHVQIRVSTWLDPFSDASGTGYQLVQSLFSIADGGMFGVGIGNGMAEDIPVVESDFIFSSIAEELGLLGAAAVLLLYVCFTIRGCLTAARAKSDVSSFIAVGLTASIALQAFIIVGGVTRLIPLTGLTLPFISQGGSSLLASFMAVGMLLRCGDEGTGIGTEIQQNTMSISGIGVLGRVSLGKRITAVVVVICALFALLLANLTYLMVVEASDLQNMSNNNHTIAKQEKSQRGTISTSDGVVLAKSVLEDGTDIYKRVYPHGKLASNVVGYASTQYGTSGIESTYNSQLQGNQSYSSWSDVLAGMSGSGVKGNDITLTINSKIQKAANKALKGYKGACVVINPKTGAILAMATSPTYDSNDIDDILSGKDTGTKVSDGALLNRATNTLYAPGSTFKIVTLSTALENDIADEDSTYSSPGSITIGGGKIYNFDHNNYGTLTLEQATALSSNTVFAQVGTEIGSDLLVSSAKSFGFNRELDFDIPLYTSLMPDADEMTEWETAWAADGQPVGEHDSPAGPQATVLQMAMVGCAIANDGVIEKPYLVEGIYNSEGVRSFTASSEAYLSPISSNTAKRVRKVLETVVKSGTGTAAAIDGVTVAGKTGTAETGKAKDNSWFVGMAPSDDADVVVAIVCEEADEGTATARSKQVMTTALEVMGDL
jgi:cell division protein FtsI/penicillin-binding protein 2/cell division protein FtsW (lipid II flippase)